MGELLEVVTALHRRTSRDYLGRMQDAKVECMNVAKKYGYDYWDGDRRYGYGGYRYDGRWKVVAEALVRRYGLRDNASILDVGCGKGYLMFEFRKLLPEARIAGFDISPYALEHSKEELSGSLSVARAQNPFPYADNEFDLVLSLTTLHNLEIFDLKKALQEIERVGKKKYIVVESYRNDQELFNLQCWALTCESFLSNKAWEWLFSEFSYTGDYEFIYFE